MLNHQKDKDTGKGIPGTLGEGTVGATSSAGRDSNKYISSSVVCFSREWKNTHTLSSIISGLVCASLDFLTNNPGSRQTSQITLDLGS